MATLPRKMLIAFSTMVLLGAVMLWIRGTWFADYVTFQTSRRSDVRWRYWCLQFKSEQNRIVIDAFEYDTSDPELLKIYRYAPIGPLVSLRSLASTWRPQSNPTDPCSRRHGYAHDSIAPKA